MSRILESCKLFVEESFGPVIAVTPANDGIQAMIDLVNLSEYTLTNSVYGTNVEDFMTDEIWICSYKRTYRFCISIMKVD